ncbi:MAG: alpha/beta hydrolase [Hoeflea sp.]|uniref:alpha/beta fold hydrolase n=1 Tax=Hoeflea sp. TaxID=1940281 RepID=UPI001DE66A8B|nr:alpha/beta hydrolase [Hoeflea sp.]MBU4528248.1 alpha/beta hydrolase [Alphaproteobacteria bacterium]MBU4543844.1 alpha/beta hydrolase [Alphaproteobacteria bacterium]MBU4548485.1 alpha/beta hydrolase [Alphaproteobacteria bacterium]MBV1722564.1 alpha/beta hydrolase [Hoeflea sp.]MBV1762233.1 alpha/beta hydrolase [Hoeflea sp.]
MIYLILALVLLLAALVAWTQVKAREIEALYPPIGEMIDVGDYRLHAVHIPRPDTADLPALVFIHGASGNLRDQLIPFRSKFEGRAEMLFIDRPGHGWSDRGGSENNTPDGQANAIIRAMQAKGISSAIIIGHSFGGAIAASLALGHPEMTAGLVFLAPATHPWPGGIAWYYGLTSTPLIGPLFAHTFAVPAGLSRLESGSACVFAPNPKPDDYVTQTAPALVLRPEAFRNNAIDVHNLQPYATRVAPRYSEITAPTVIITGDSDSVVLAHIHSEGLARDIPGAELIWIRNLGHKPDHVTTDLAIRAIEKMAGFPVDLKAAAAAAEAALAGDDATCPGEAPSAG